MAGDGETARAGAADVVEMTSRRSGDSEELSADEAVARLRAIYQPALDAAKA